jgi:hypothetical protein
LFLAWGQLVNLMSGVRTHPCNLDIPKNLPIHLHFHTLIVELSLKFLLAVPHTLHIQETKLGTVLMPIRMSTLSDNNPFLISYHLKTLLTKTWCTLLWPSLFLRALSIHKFYLTRLNLTAAQLFNQSIVLDVCGA